MTGLQKMYLYKALALAAKAPWQRLKQCLLRDWLEQYTCFDWFYDPLYSHGMHDANYILIFSPQHKLFNKEITETRDKNKHL